MNKSQKLTLIMLFLLVIAAVAAAQEQVISTQTAVDRLNQLLIDKKIAVDFVDTVDDAGKTAEWTKMLVKDNDALTEIQAITGQRRQIYYNAVEKQFVGPGAQAKGAKIIRTDLIEQGGSFVDDYWKLQNQIAQLKAEKADLINRSRQAVQQLPDLQKQLDETSGWSPFKRSKLQGQIDKATKEAENAVNEVAKINNQIDDATNASKAIIKTVSEDGTKLTRTARLWQWVKDTQVGKSVGKASSWTAEKLGLTKIAEETAEKKGAKWVVGKVIGKSLIIAGIVYDIVRISAPYTNMLQETAGPNVTISPDVGFPRNEPIIVTDDKQTHIFYNTTIDPNSSQNIRKVESFRESIDNYFKEHPYLDFIQSAVGIGAADIYEYAADYGETFGEDQFVLGCVIEVYKLDSAWKKTELVTKSNNYNCHSGSNPHQEFVSEKEFEPGTYQIILRAFFDPRIIVFAQEDIKKKASQFQDLLPDEEVQGISEDEIKSTLADAGLPPNQVNSLTQSIKDYVKDPIIGKILFTGYPAKTSIIEVKQKTENAQSESYKIRYLKIYSKSTSEEKNNFNEDEINDIQIRFDFAYPTNGFLLAIFEKGDEANTDKILAETDDIGPYPAGNDALQKVGIASYIFDNDTQPQAFSSFASKLAKGGVFTLGLLVAYKNQTNGAVEIRPDFASTMELAINRGDGTIIGPNPSETLTTGHVIFRVANKDQIESTGVSLEEYAKGLSISMNGEIVASYSETDQTKRIYLQGEYLILNNIIKSDKRNIPYEINWERTGFKKGKGSMTVEVNDSEVKNGVWKEGDQIE